MDKNLIDLLIDPSAEKITHWYERLGYGAFITLTGFIITIGTWLESTHGQLKGLMNDEIIFMSVGVFLIMIGGLFLIFRIVLFNKLKLHDLEMRRKIVDAVIEVSKRTGSNMMDMFKDLGKTEETKIA